MGEKEAYEHQTIGPPGCGKTTWLARQAQRAYEEDMNVAVYSLTRAAAAEVAGRDLPPGTRTGTLHAQCHEALNRPKMTADSSAIAAWNEEYREWRITPAQNSNPDMEQEHDTHEQKSTGDWALAQAQILRAKMTPPDSWPPEVRRIHQYWEDFKKQNGLLDFADLIEKCLENVEYAPGEPEVIFADECQDFDSAQMALTRKWGEGAGMLVTVGDPDQCLYQWRGSEPAAFIRVDLPPENRRILGQSYRVPKLPHSAAMRWIRGDNTRQDFDYQPREETGRLENLEFGYSHPEALLEHAKESLEQDKTVMFITACSYMLEPLIQELRRRGEPFHNPLRPSNGAWNPLTPKEGAITSADRIESFLALSERGEMTVKELQAWAGTLKIRETLAVPSGKKFLKSLDSRAQEESREAALVEINELTEWLKPEAMEAVLCGDLEWYLRVMHGARRRAAEFPTKIVEKLGVEALREKPQVIVGTIHSAKGGEADVCYLFPDLSPTGKVAWNGGAAERAEIYRLFYVGMTRCREKLVLCGATR